MTRTEIIKAVSLEVSPIQGRRGKKPLCLIQERFPSPAIHPTAGPVFAIQNPLNKGMRPTPWVTVFRLSSTTFSGGETCVSNKLPNWSNLEATSCVANTIAAATATNHTELSGIIVSYRIAQAMPAPPNV